MVLVIQLLLYLMLKCLDPGCPHHITSEIQMDVLRRLRLLSVRVTVKTWVLVVRALPSPRLK